MEKFGPGIYDLDYLTIQKFIQIMHIRDQRSRREASQTTGGNSIVTTTRKQLPTPE